MRRSEKMDFINDVLRTSNTGEEFDMLDGMIARNLGVESELFAESRWEYAIS